MGQTRSWVVEAPGRMRTQTFPVPDVDEAGLLLRVEMVGICGTDPIIFNGRLPYAPFPIILGHEVVGRVEAIGSDAARLYGVAPGDRVTVEPYIICGKCRYCLTGYYQLCDTKSCYGVSISSAKPPHLWGAYGEYLYVGPGSKVHRVADGIPLESAMLSSVLANGIRWVRTKAHVEMYETVVIIGPGAQGLASTIAAREAGADPIVVLGLSRDADRLALAKEFGAHHTLAVDEADPLDALARLTGGRMADVVIECSGSSAGRDLALRAAGKLGRVVFVGLRGADDQGISLDLVVDKELRLYGGLGQSWDVEPAMRIINSGKYDLTRMVSHVFPMEQADEALKFFMDRPEECIRVALSNSLNGKG